MGVKIKSALGSVTLDAENIASNTTVTVPAGGGTLANTGVTDALSTRVNAVGGRKNLIINGAMQVAQRGTSTTGTNIVYGSVDRFGGNAYLLGSFNNTDEQVEDAPAGFLYSRKLTVNTAATTSATSRCQFRYNVEGYDIDQFNWGTSDAKTVTLSFWVKASVTGTYALSLINGTETYSYVTNYTISSANTWERKTITITGPTVGTWDGTNNIGIRLAWDFGSGSNYNSSTSDSWVSGWFFNTASSTNMTTTTNATFQITGVQLELGDTATDFEHRSFGEELALCMRYYQTINKMVGIGQNGVSNTIYSSIEFPTPMRTTPSIGQTGVFAFEIPFGTSSTQSSTSATLASGNTNSGIYFYMGNFSGLSGSQMYMKHSNTNLLKLDAEL